MTENNEPLYYVIPQESFMAERRVFKQGEEYPVYEIAGGFCLVAENGAFNFTNKIFASVLHDWKLERVSE